MAQIPRDPLSTVLRSEISISVLGQDDTGCDASVGADESTVAASRGAVGARRVAACSAPCANALC